MTRVQVLDVGDRVRTGGWTLGTCVVLQQHDTWKKYLVCEPESGETGWLMRSSLERIGGDLQVGDFVQVTGTVEPTWTSAEEEMEEETGVIVDDCADGDGIDFYVYVMGEMDLYECHTDYLTRITKAEVLA